LALGLEVLRGGSGFLLRHDRSANMLAHK
jgi:hypothetical protein